MLAVIVARDTADVGRPDYTMQDLLADWSLPELDFERDHFVVADDDGTLVGWADVNAGGARLAVHPDHEGRGVGTLLREASEARMREMGIPLRQSVIPANTAAIEHLRSAGYERIQVFKRLRADLDSVPPPLDAPVRAFDLEAEGRLVHEHEVRHDQRAGDGCDESPVPRAGYSSHLLLAAEVGSVSVAVGRPRGSSGSTPR